MDKPSIPTESTEPTRDSINKLVRRLEERRMSVSGFLENITNHHLKTYKVVLEQWKQL